MRVDEAEPAPRRHVSGPRGYPLLGVAPQLKSDPLGLVVESFRQYGDVFALPTPKGKIHCFAHPDHLEIVLGQTGKLFGRSDRARAYLPIFGEGLFLSEGAEWVRQRRLLQPSFHGRQIAGFFEVFAASTEEMLARWDGFAARGETFDLAPELMSLTMSIIVRTMFSAQVRGEAEEIAANFTVLLEHIDRQWLQWVSAPKWFPSRANQRFQTALETLDRVVLHIIGLGRERGTQEGDLLSALIAARDEETGQALDDRELRDQVMSIFLAGHETTANALCWTYYLLARHPGEEAKMWTEIDTQLGGRKLALGDCAALPRTRMVFEEAMRLCPPLWAITRRVLKDHEFAGCELRAGGTVMLLPYLTHRHPDFWEDPETFDPSRFAAERGDARHRFAYVPFGGGPRSCIGRSFALLEAQTILAKVAQRYQVTLAPGAKVQLQPMGVLRPKGGIQVQLLRREAEGAQHERP